MKNMLKNLLSILFGLAVIVVALFAFLSSSLGLS